MSFPLRRRSVIATPEMASYLLTRSEGTIGEPAQAAYHWKRAQQDAES